MKVIVLEKSFFLLIGFFLLVMICGLFFWGGEGEEEKGGDPLKGLLEGEMGSWLGHGADITRGMNSVGMSWLEYSAPASLERCMGRSDTSGIFPGEIVAYYNADGDFSSWGKKEGDGYVLNKAQVVRELSPVFGEGIRKGVIRWDWDGRDMRYTFFVNEGEEAFWYCYFVEEGTFLSVFLRDVSFVSGCEGEIGKNGSGYDSEERRNSVKGVEWRYSENDSPKKCEYRCDAGYSWDGTDCIVLHEGVGVVESEPSNPSDANLDDPNNPNNAPCDRREGGEGCFGQTLDGKWYSLEDDLKGRVKGPLYQGLVVSGQNGRDSTFNLGIFDVPGPSAETQWGCDGNDSTAPIRTFRDQCGGRGSLYNRTYAMRLGKPASTSGRLPNSLISVEVLGDPGTFHVVLSDQPYDLARPKPAGAKTCDIPAIAGRMGFTVDGCELMSNAAASTGALNLYLLAKPNNGDACGKTKRCVLYVNSWGYLPISTQTTQMTMQNEGRGIEEEDSSGPNNPNNPNNAPCDRREGGEGCFGQTLDGKWYSLEDDLKGRVKGPLYQGLVVSGQNGRDSTFNLGIFDVPGVEAETQWGCDGNDSTNPIRTYRDQCGGRGSLYNRTYAMRLGKPASTSGRLPRSLISVEVLGDPGTFHVVLSDQPYDLARPKPAGAKTCEIPAIAGRMGFTVEGCELMSKAAASTGTLNLYLLAKPNNGDACGKTKRCVLYVNSWGYLPISTQTTQMTMQNEGRGIEEEDSSDPNNPNNAPCDRREGGEGCFGQTLDGKWWTMEEELAGKTNGESLFVGLRGDAFSMAVFSNPVNEQETQWGCQGPDTTPARDWRSPSRDPSIACLPGSLKPRTYAMRLPVVDGLLPRPDITVDSNNAGGHHRNWVYALSDRPFDLAGTTPPDAQACVSSARASTRFTTTTCQIFRDAQSWQGERYLYLMARPVGTDAANCGIDAYYCRLYVWAWGLGR